MVLLTGKATAFARSQTAERTWFWVALMAALAFAPYAGATPEDEIRRIVDEERARGGAPALSVVVISDGQVLAEYATGLADIEAGVGATPETQFPAASVSKILTAVLVMRQVEAGRLNLDAPVNTYLEPHLWVRDQGGEPVDATLRQLLSHSSGLPMAWDGIVAWGDPVSTMEDHLAQGLRTIHAPGDRVVYANDGLALAGYVAAQAAGQPFADLARQALFEPLGMTRSTFESPWQLEGSLAAGYGNLFFSSSDRAHHADATAIAPAGGLITTSPDLARFALMLLGEGELDGVRILRPESVAEMMRLQARGHPDLDEGFGLGFGARVRPDWRMVWWDGAITGAAARLALLPDAELGVVVLSNLADNDITAVTGRRILDALAPFPTAKYHASTEEFARVTGLYRMVEYLGPEQSYLGYFVAFEVERRGEELWQSSPISGERILIPVGPNRFRLMGSMYDDATVLFDGDMMHMGFIRARRISVWASPTAIVTYGAIFALLLISILGLGVWRLAQRLRGS
jgi:CubicO group peptidase (beta-lactamase class C family)